MDVGGSWLGCAPTSPLLAGEEGALLGVPGLGAIPGLRVPLLKASPASSGSPPTDEGLAHLLGRKPVPASKGRARRLNAPQGSLGSQSLGSTAWWARPCGPHLQTWGLGEQGLPPTPPCCTLWGRLADALCETWLKCMTEEG